MNRRNALIALAALGLSACASLPGSLTPPEVTVADLRLLEGGLLEQRYGMTLRVLNPNEVDIPVEGLSFAIELNGKPFAKGVSNQSVTLPRLGEAMIDVDAVSSLSGLLRQLGAMVKGREARLDYRVHGRLVTGGFGGSVPFDQSGEIDFEDLTGFPAGSEGERF